MPDPLVFALILAAGQGRRFGGDKLLAGLHGKPVLRHVLDWVVEARSTGHLGGGLAVIPAGNFARELLLLETKTEYVFNATPESGVADTLRIGLAALAARYPDAEAALVLQGDQPGLRSDVLGALLSDWRTGGRPVVRPRYAGDPGTPGHPVLIARSAWSRAMELEGDTGFGPLLRQYPELVTVVDVPGTNPDINTPSDLAALESSAR